MKYSPVAHVKQPSIAIKKIASWILATWLLGLLLVAGGVGNVQAAGYAASITTAYPQLAIPSTSSMVKWYGGNCGGTVATASPYAACDDGVSPVMGLGFSFSFAGAAYTTWSMSSNGVIFFETGAVGTASTGGTSYTPNPLPTATFGVGKPALMPFWADLWKGASLNNVTDASAPGQPAAASFVQYQTLTVSGAPVLVIQLKKVGFYSASTVPVNMQIQIWSTGQIVYAYDAMSAITAGNIGLTVGLQYAGGGCSSLANKLSTSLSGQSYLFAWDASAANCQSIPAVNHYEIRQSGTATLCAEPVTVLACSSGTAPCPTATIIKTQIINAAVTVTGVPATPSATNPNINPVSFNLQPAAPLQTVNLTWASGSSGTATLGIQAAVIASGNVVCTNAAGTATRACTMTVANAACIAPPHHYEIQGPAGGTNCGSHSFTIKAWADASQTIAYTAGAATGTLTSSGNPVSIPSLGAFTIAAGNSTVSITPITFPAAGTTTFSSTATPPLTGTTTCNFGGSTSCAFVVVSCVTDFNCVETTTNAASAADSSAASGKLYTKLAGTAFSFDVVARRADGLAVGTYASDADKPVSVELVEGSDATACGSRVALSPPVASQLLTFTKLNQPSDLGRKSVSFTVSDAYRNVRCRVTDTTNTSIKGCSTDGFAIRPSAVTLVTTANAVAPSGTASPIVRAGTNFTLRATTSTGSNYAGVLTQDASKLMSQDPASATKAYGGAVGALAPASLTSNSAAVNATYTEVGHLYLGAGAFADTTYTAVDNNANGECIAGSLSVTLAAGKYGCNIGNAAEVSLGRFVPDHFHSAIVPATSPVACPPGLTCPSNSAGASGLLYSTQPFTVQLTAKNAAEGTAANYQGIFAKTHTLSAWNAAGGATANPGDGTLSNTMIAATAFAAGVGSSASPTYALSSATTAPTNVFFRTTDADAITSLRSSGTVEAGLKVASGRIKVPNAYGSERLTLPVTTTVQYYQGNSWVTSLTDNVSTYNSALTTATPTPGNVQLAAASGLGSPAGSAVSVVSPAVSAVVAGVRTFNLAAPMFPGHVNISISAPIYLPSTTGLASFGLFRSPLIYRRENY